MNVYDLYAKITLDQSEYDKGLEDSEGKAKSFASRLKGGLATAGKVGAAAVGAVTVATAAMGAAVVKQTGEIAAYGDNIDKMSQKMGMSAEAYQEWDAIMQHSGTSIDSMQAGMKTLASAAETGNKAFEKLGMSQEEIANMSQEELFGATITALQNVESETERTYLAGQLLGRGATELGALLNTSAEDTEKMRQTVHDLGGVMSDEAVKASAAYQDSLQDMQTSLSGLKRGIISDFLPSLTGVMDGLTMIFSGDTEGGLGKVKEGISVFIENLQEAIPRLLEIGGSILSALYQAIMDNLPQIIEGGTVLIVNLITGLIQALPELIPAVVTLVATVVRTLWEHFPEIVQAGRDAVASLTGGMDPGQLAQKGLELLARLLASIAAKLPEMLQKGIELVGQLAAGLIRAIPTLISKIPTIINRVKSTFSQFDWASIGLNIITGIARGIANAASAIGSALMGAVKGAWDTVTGWLGIKSPSKKAEKEIGVNWSRGIGLGFVRDMPKEGLMMADAVSDAFNGLLGDGIGFDGNESVGGTFAPVINVYGAQGQDVNDLADIVMDKMTRELKRRRGSYAIA